MLLGVDLLSQLETMMAAVENYAQQKKGRLFTFYVLRMLYLNFPAEHG